MSYTNHTKTVNDALHALLLGEFSIPVDYSAYDDYDPDFRSGECIRYYNIDQPPAGGNSSGEDRQFDYELDYWFSNRNVEKKDYDAKIWARYEQVRQLLKENSTYQPSSAYKWHDIEIETMVIVDVLDEDDNKTGEKAIHLEFNMKRFCQWA